MHVGVHVCVSAAITDFADRTALLAFHLQLYLQLYLGAASLSSLERVLVYA